MEYHVRDVQVVIARLHGIDTERNRKIQQIVHRFQAGATWSPSHHRHGSRDGG